MSQAESINISVIEQLRELVDEDDPNFLVDLLQGYIDEIDRTLPELSNGISLDKAVQVARQSHTLKGASSNIGAQYMTTLFKQLELAADARNWPEATRILNEIKQEFQDVRTVLTTYL